MWKGLSENRERPNDIPKELYDKVLLLARLEGYKTYNKTVLCAEMPISIYEDLCLRDDDQEFYLKKKHKKEQMNTFGINQ